MNTKILHEVEFRQAITLALPTVFAYFPLGAVFGVLFVQSGFDSWLAPLMSITAFGGAAQFVALSMMNDHSTFTAISFASLFVVLRNSFYGLSLLRRFETHWLLKSYLIFNLVDATYAILTTHNPKEGQNDIKFCFYLSSIIYASWVGGTIFGTLFAPWLPKFSGMDFILPCFFLVLVIEYYMATRSLASIILPSIAAIIAYMIKPEYFLFIAIVLSILSIFFIQGYKELKP